jgi:hypothetical protein
MTIENEGEQPANEELLPNDEATESEQLEEEVSEEQSADDTGVVDEDPKEKGFQKRINEVTRARREAEAKVEALSKLLLEKTAQEKPLQEQSKQEAQAPMMDDFDTVEDFVQASVAYGVSKQLESHYKGQEVSKAEQAQQERIQNVYQKVNDFIAKVPDAFDKFEVIKEELIPFLAETEKPAEVAYYLANNPDALKDLYVNPNAIAVARKLGKIEASLSTQTKKPNQPLQAPLKTLTGRGTTSPTKDPSAMTMEEYRNYRMSK